MLKVRLSRKKLTVVDPTKTADVGIIRYQI